MRISFVAYLAFYIPSKASTWLCFLTKKCSVTTMYHVLCQAVWIQYWKAQPYSLEPWALRSNRELWSREFIVVYVSLQSTMGAYRRVSQPRFRHTSWLATKNDTKEHILEIKLEKGGYCVGLLFEVKLCRRELTIDRTDEVIDPNRWGELEGEVEEDSWSFWVTVDQCVGCLSSSF